MDALVDGPQYQRLIEGELPEITTGDVQPLSQVVGGGRRIRFRPEEVGQLISVQHVVRGNRETLDDLRRVATTPGRGENLGFAHRESESPEKLDA